MVSGSTELAEVLSNHERRFGTCSPFDVLGCAEPLRANGDG
jgi:hypothetical protein